MDERFTSILIDEPELGLSPKVQTALSTFFQDQEERKKYFPHLERVYLATHSHLFLARSDIMSNYVVTKTGKRVTLARVQDIGEFPSSSIQPSWKRVREHVLSVGNRGC